MSANKLKPFVTVLKHPSGGYIATMLFPFKDIPPFEWERRTSVVGPWDIANALRDAESWATDEELEYKPYGEPLEDFLKRVNPPPATHVVTKLPRSSDLFDAIKRQDASLTALVLEGIIEDLIDDPDELHSFMASLSNEVEY